jgi:hypothetical protein
MRISFWWRDTARLYLRYMTAISASVPAAVAYAYLATKKLDSWWSTLGLLAVGLGTATVGWHFSQLLFPSDQKPALTEAYSDVTYGFGVRFAAAAMAASFVVLCGEPSKQMFSNQKNVVGGDAQVLSAPATLASVSTEG